ncbi:glycoprotein precursor [Pongola virus - SAAr1]|uniref:Envelopment polyprotein n=1 Tax=Pongola virus - SAAr1 TaxID=537994 RepID=A0A088MSL9_9VIRU|nr:glycoprotein precursor [Pongola virus - SAAr1]
MICICIFVAIFPAIYAIPDSYSRCFTGGTVVKEMWSKDAVTELCIKDDVSIVKTETSYKKNGTGTFALNKVTRKWLMTDWEKCKPQKSSSGHINVIEVRDDLTLATSTYICSSSCTINVDRETAQIQLNTDSINHFEIAGTTIKTGWFKSTTLVALDQTCEHLKVSCGKQSVQFHACFNQHMSCVRFLHRTILPGNMAKSICQNIEIIILVGLIILIFLLLCILTKTYICYILLPIFIPLSYAYGYFYNKACKKCSQCGLVYHPFTECGSNCVCGARYDTSERMKLHRISGLCPGYKSLRTARVLCKSKGSASILSILISILILMFVTPINGYMITNEFDEGKLTVDSLPDDMLSMISRLSALQFIFTLNIACSVLVTLLTCLFLIIFYRFQHRFLSKYAINCTECDMYHQKKGLIYNGDFTNKCMTCTCGEVNDMEGLNKHKKRYNCLIKYKAAWFLNLTITIICLMLIKDGSMMAAAETNIETCMAKPSLTTDCTGPFLKITKCDESQKALPFQEIAKQLVKSNVLTLLDKHIVEKLPNEIAGSLSILDKKQHYHEQLAVEYGILSKYCDYYELYKSNSGYSQSTWGTYLRSHDFEICLLLPYQYVCRCFKSGTGCTDTKFEFEQKMNETYNSKNDMYNSDFTLALTVLHLAMRGTASTYIIDNVLQKNYSNVIEYLNTTKNNFKSNQVFGVLVDFTIYLLRHASYAKYNLPQSLKKFRSVSSDLTTISGRSSGQNIVSDLHQGDVIKTCLNIKQLNCISPKSRTTTTNLITCGSSQISVYNLPRGQLYESVTTEHGTCAGDGHCLTDFMPINSDFLATLKKSKCWTTDIPNIIKLVESDGKISCQPIDVGSCNVSGNIWTITKCSDNKYYYTDNKHVHDDEKDIGHYCMEETCKFVRFPINDKFVSNCEWDLNHIEINKLNQVELDNINAYKKVLTEKLTSSLSVFKYKLTQNLPHVIPKFKYITIQGTQTVDGIENSFIEVEIPALSGAASGFKIMTKENNELFDAILYVKQASFSSIYKKIYTTGPTIGINTKHDEKCTGACPVNLPHSTGWLTFAKERTSTWGCEEYGCLAINDGCVFGSCQDIIKDEMYIFKKETEEVALVEICISFNHKTFCTDVDSTTPIITDTLEAQFKTVESYKLPNHVALKQHKLYVGQINDFGVYKKACGNVQKINNTIYGEGTPRFDYLCHLAKRKDVLVRKCFDNDYNSCSLLTIADDLRLEEDGEKLKVINYRKVLGSMKFKALFGDIRYKSFTEDIELDVEASCAGCINCFDNIHCEIKLTNGLDTSCSFESSCDAFNSRILFNSNQHVYSTKLICTKEQTKAFEIKICGKTIKADLVVTEAKPILELTPIDQTSYIKEEDTRCGTWFCRLTKEGFSVLLEPFKNLFGSYLGIAYTIIIALLCLFVFIYIILPMIMKLKEVLKQNEIAYQKEQKKR